jgi:hypothetical protein
MSPDQLDKFDTLKEADNIVDIGAVWYSWRQSDNNQDFLRSRDHTLWMVEIKK